MPGAWWAGRFPAVQDGSLCGDAAQCVEANEAAPERADESQLRPTKPS